MANNPSPECSIEYTQDGVVLTGDAEAIHDEAQRILHRFAHSITPLRIVTDSRHRLVLGPK